MLIYVAGPIRPHGAQTVEGNIQKAKDIAFELWKMGHAVICPHANTFLTEGIWCNEDKYPVNWIKGDLQMVARCDAVVVCPDFSESKGTRMEIAFAEEHDIPVFYYPTLPPLHPTELQSPIQCGAFIDTIMSIYRTHLKKNADYCVDPETPVLTSELEWVPIKDITVGMKLIGFDEFALMGNKRRMFRVSTVESVSKVRLPSRKLTLENGDVLISSDEHPWLVKSGLTSRWVTAKNLEPSESDSTPSKIIKLFDTWVPDYSYSAGYLAGALDGEGWLSQTPNHQHGGGTCFRLGFAQKDNAMLDCVTAILRSRGIDYRLAPANGQNTCNQIVIRNTPRKDLIRLLGEVRPKRLISNLSSDLGMVFSYPQTLLRNEAIGMHDLISIKTSTATYVANGYGSHNSPANILGTGELGVIVRLWDKIARLLNLAGFRLKVEAAKFDAPREPKNESIDDAYMDLTCYGIIGMLVRKGLWGK